MVFFRSSSSLQDWGLTRKSFQRVVSITWQGFHWSLLLPYSFLGDPPSKPCQDDCPPIGPLLSSTPFQLVQLLLHPKVTIFLCFFWIHKTHPPICWLKTQKKMFTVVGRNFWWWIGSALFLGPRITTIPGTMVVTRFPGDRSQHNTSISTNLSSISFPSPLWSNSSFNLIWTDVRELQDWWSWCKHCADHSELENINHWW